jgi:hypothetical protein
MNAGEKVYLFTSLLMFVASNVLADPFGTFGQSVTTQLTDQLSKNQMANVLETVRGQCDQSLADAKSRQKTVFERASSASDALQCLNKGRGLLVALAPDAETRAKVKELLQPFTDEAAQVKQQADSEANFMGLNWGIGFGYSFGSDEMIDDAEIVNGIVRVKSQKKEQPRVVLEFHKYFWCNDSYKSGASGCGPFVAVAATQDKVLSGVGMGFMYGLKAKTNDADGFSVGAGVILDGKVKDLADGFKKNEAPPSGETQVRLEEKARWSYLMFVTRTF